MGLKKTILAAGVMVATISLPSVSGGPPNYCVTGPCIPGPGITTTAAPNPSNPVWTSPDVMVGFTVTGSDYDSCGDPVACADQVTYKWEKETAAGWVTLSGTGSTVNVYWETADIGVRHIKCTVSDLGLKAKDPDADPVVFTVYVAKPVITTDSNNDGSIDEATDGPVATVYPGRIIRLNDDDDNGNGTADKDESPVTSEDDLVQVDLSCLPSTGIIGGQLKLEISSGTSIRLWDTQTKDHEIVSGQIYTVESLPPHIWVECVGMGASVLDLVLLKSVGTVVLSRDQVLFSTPNSYRISYDDTSRTKTVKNGNGTRAIYSYNERYKLTQVQHEHIYTVPVDQTIAQVGYGLDGMGYRTNIDIFLSKGNTPYQSSTSFTYDALNRLLSEGTTIFGYDWAGNRTSPGGLVYDSADRITSWPNMRTYYYYPDGCLQTIQINGSSSTKTFTYDARGLLMSAGGY